MRRIVILAALILSSAFGARAQTPNTISTVAGGGTNTSTATSAYLSGSFGVARDATNHVTYLSISALSIVYKVDSSGNMTPYAGNGVLGFSGDGKAATSAQLNSPSGLAVDGGGNLFIADSQNNRIRKVDTSGIITTVAGSGNQYNGVGFFGGFSPPPGQSGPAISALMNFPTAVAVDGNGNLFIADSGNNVIRKVDNSPDHIITTYAGGAATVCAGATDPIGDGCPATSAQLNSPEGLAVDSVGNVFIADSGDNLVRMVNTVQIITTYAGGGTGCTAQTDPLGDGCPANQAGLNNPQGVSVDSSDNLYIADTFNNRIRKVDGIAPHNISTLAGSASICLATTGCGDGGAATSALLNSPTSVAVDGSTLNVFFCDAGTQRFRMVIPGTTPIINSYAGGGAGGDGNAATAAVIGSPGFVIVDGAGDLFVVDGAASRIRKVNASQVISNFAGNGVVGPPGNSNGDGSSALQANLTQVTRGMAFDPSGNLYFIDRSNFVIRRIDTSGTITRVAGNYGQRCAGASLPSCGDGGLATSALLRAPTGIAVDSTGNVYISDGGLNRIRVFSPSGNISNFAGTGAAGSANGPASSATFNAPWGIAFDANGNLYVADSNNSLIRKIDSTTQHNVTTYAFNGVATFGGDGGTALSASMQFPQQVALDSAGNLYVGGGFDNVVRRIDVNDQSVITVAGDVHNLDGGFSGDGGPSTKALLENFGLAILKNTSNNTNTLYIADTGNNRIRKVVLAPVAQVSPSALQDFGPVLQGGFGAPQIITIVNNGLDDLVLTPGTAPPGFAVTNDCVSLTTFTPAPLAPGQSCLLIVQFGPGAMTGAISGTFTLTTNDPANPSFPFQLSGTAVAPPGVALTVTVSPSPSSPNPVVVSSPSGIDCPTTCSSNFAAGEIVNLNAISSSTSGQAFIGWTVNGSTTTCPGTGACTLTMSQAQNVTANFGPASVTVSALGNGSGTITINPGGVNCTVTNGVIAPNPCIATNFPAGTTTVTVTANATGNSSFAGWLGFCSATGINNAGTGPCDLSLTLASLPSLSGALATAVFSGPPVAFSQGQVFVGTVDGMIFVYNPNGTLAQVLNSGNLGGTIAGMNFDATGNLYAANLVANTVERFASGTAGPTTFGTGYNSGPLGVLVDALGNVFVGQSGGQKSLLEFAVPFNGNGTPTNTFFPAYDIGGIGYLELLDDGASVLYTSSTQTGAGLGSVKNYDIANSHQNPDFATNLPGGPAFAVRELSDKSVLVANSTQIVRIDPISRNVVKTYTPGGAGVFFALNLNPDGQSFWAGDAATGKVYQINLATGAVMNTINTGLGFNTATLTFSTVFGIAVFGQPQSGGADLAVTMTASPNPVAQGSQLTYTITVKNNGPLAAANVAVTDALPAGATFVSASTGQGTCSGTTTVTCNLGTGSNGMSATITIVVTATQAGALTNTVNVNATTPDPIPGNNSFTTTTTVTATGPMPAAITLNAPSSVQLGTGLTYAIQVTNPGTTTLTNLTVADTLPGNLNATALSTGCTGTNAITCTIATLTPGQIVEFDITIVPTTLGTLTNTGASVTGGGNSGPVSTNVINNGVALVIELFSTNAADFVTSSPSSGDCTTAQVLCTTYFPSGSTVVLTANGPGFIGWQIVDGSQTTCPGTGTCSVTMSQEHGVQALYNSPVAWLISTLPGGVVNVPYGVDLSQDVLGGQQPYTFSLASGTLPGTLAINGSIISGVPNAVGPFPITLKVTDSSTPPETATFTTAIPVITPPNTQAALLNGPYAVLFRGASDADASLRDFVGSLTFGGNGNIPSGTVDINGNGTSPGVQSLTVTGTYTIGPDNRGLAFLNSSDGSHEIFAFAVGDVYQGIARTARIIRFDDDTGTGTRGAGIMRRQDANAFTANSFAGTYVFAGDGQDPTSGQSTEIGLITANNAQAFASGSADLNDNGTLQSIPSITGTYTSISAGTGRTQWSLNNGATSAASYIVDANNVVFMTLNPGASNVVIAGTAERQSIPTGGFTNSSLTGPDVVSEEGPTGGFNSSNSQVFLGLATTSVVGGVPTVTLNFDSNNNQNIVIEGTKSAPYSVLASGRVTINFAAPDSPVILYLSRPDHGFLMSTDPNPGFGQIELQHGGPFTNGSFPGGYFIGSREPATPSGGDVASGVSTVNGNTFNFTIDDSHRRGTVEYGNTGSFGISVAPNGRVIFPANRNGTSGTNNEIGYAISPSRIVLADVDPTSHHPNIIESQTIAMPPGAASPNPTSVTFTTPVAIGSIALSAPITFTNVGDGLLSITGHTNATDFFASGTCLTAPPVVVISQGTCTVIITFAPVAGTPTNTLLHETVTLQTDAGTVTINASGTAAAAAGPPVLSITKSHVGNFTQGQQGAIYTVTVSNAANAGPTTGSVVVVTDTIPTGLTLTALSGSGWLCTVSTASCQTTVVLAGGASYPPITVTVNVAANATSPQVNVVNMVGGGSVAANASDSTVITPSTSPTLVSIAVTPANPSIAKGRTQQFTATGTFSDNSTQNITNSVTWASATTSVATISNVVGSQGLATGVNTGTSTISATQSGINGSTVLTVGPAVLASLNVTPKNQQIVVGSTLQFTATGTLTDGTIQDFTKTVTWSSSKLTVATISNTAPTQGLATAVSTVNSPTVITAVQGGIQDLTQLGVIAAPTFVLTVTEAGSGAGTVTSSPAGINCPTQCTASYASGTPVTLTATPATGSTFAGWSGACTNATGTCPVTMNQAQAVTATFNGTVTTFPLTVVTAGTGTGTVTGNGINCTSGSTTGCAVNLGAGTAVTLTAAPATGSTFAGWSATPTSCNVTGTTCTFSMPASAETATATFTLPSGLLLVPDFNVGGAGADDKQRIDGKSSPLRVGLTNTSKTQTVHVTGASADNPAYAVTTDCTTLGPGQACSVFATFKATQLCENQAGNITVADDDPGGNLIVSVNGYGADSGLQVDNLTNPALTAQALAQSLVGPGVTISNVKYTGALRAAGNFTGNPNIIGFGSGIVLSTGSVRNVVGPNCSSQIGVDNGQPGDADLNGLLGSGQTTNDAAVLEFDFVPASPSVSFQYVFSSDEYNEFVGQFNDVFAFFLNGNNIALLPTTPPVPVSINNVNTTTNPTFFVNNDMLFPNVAPVDTEMDGLTVVLTAQAQVTPNQTNHIKLAIADAIDFALDSNVFIKAGSLASAAVTLTPPTLGFGNQPVNTQSNPQQVTLANAGTATVNISSIVASAGFGETDNCPKQLAPAGQAASSCTLNITFTPTSNVVFNGTVTVTDDSPAAGSQQVVTLSGTGTGTAPTLQSITVAPATVSILAGTTQAFTATGHFSDGSSGAVTVTWSSGNTGIATVNAATGVATGVTAGGPVTITATSTLTPAITGTAQLTVTAPAVLVSIAVTPANPTVVVGQNQQFTATGTFSDKTTQDLTASVVWASSNTEAATITAGGLATGLTGGQNTIISATKTQGQSNIVGSTTLTVTTVPFVLTITPPPGGNPGAPPTVSPGGTLAIGLTLTATKGFNGTVTFSCVSNAPQFLTCAPAPSSVTLSGITPKQVAIVMNTFCQGETPMYGPGPAGGLGGGLALLLAAAMLGSITWAYRTRSRWALSFAVLMLIALGSAACSSPSSGPAGRTPAGTYTLNITATAGGASQTVQQQIQVTN